jgi:hypothetical protein
MSFTRYWFLTSLKLLKDTFFREEKETLGTLYGDYSTRNLRTSDTSDTSDTFDSRITGQPWVGDLEIV